MKYYKFYITIIFLSLILISGCSETVTNSVKNDTGELIYEKVGLIDSLVGTCSAYIVRTILLDSIDIRNYDEIKVEFNAYTDGDLSNISIYYLNSDTNYNLMVLNGLSQINNTSNYTFTSTKIKDVFFLRLRLFASVCTGQNYHLKIRDLKIYGINR